MSDGLAKPDQLVAAPSGGKTSEMDQMYSGLGLESFVGKKDTGALATGLMDTERNKKLAPMTSMASSSSSLTLEQKQKILQDSETQKRMSAQTPLTPAMSAGARSNTGGAKDLTASLINSNLNQMKPPQQQQQPMMRTSQTFSSGWSNAPSTTNANNWSSFSNSSATMLGPLGGGANSFATPAPNTQTAGMSKVDLSAFDNLLPMKSKSPVSMNAMRPGLQPMQPAAKTPVTKSLTTNDINDLLG